MSDRPQTPHNRKAIEKIRRAIARCSIRNRPFLDGLRDHMSQLGRSPKTAAPYVMLLQRLDAFTGGTSLLELQPPQVRAFLTSIASPRPRTNLTYASTLRAALSHLHDVFKDGPLPTNHPLRRAAPLPKVPKSRLEDLPIIEDSDLRLLLEAAQDAPPQYRRVYWTERVQSLIQVCRFGGFRIAEALSLNLGDAVFDEGGAALRLREEAPILGEGDHKTGPRKVYVVEGLPVLRAWMSVHPCAGDASAPLFPSFADSTGRRRMGYDSCLSVLDRLEKRSGILDGKPSDFRLHWHLFRHTCATMKVRRFNWGVIELCPYFGWSPESTEPWDYVHYRFDDLRARVRRDHGLDAAGIVRPADVGIQPAALDRLVEEKVAAALARLRQEG